MNQDYYSRPVTSYKAITHVLQAGANRPNV